MWNSGHDVYLESRVLSADPIELVNLLYQAGTVAVRDARHHLAEGRIAERSQAINRACEVVIELSSALDHKRGGEISQRLAQLYDYMLRRLLEANIQQSDAPLSETLSLLSTLSEAWEGVRPAVAMQAAHAESPWSQAAPVESPWSQPAASAGSPWALPAVKEAVGSSQGWSL
jgi:flagellar protein FliS